ncbi:hypothetical protein EJ110_NYTH37197 [Nymphaea thermarum]|nr:hypothetical protein EJ110_NYTH37197 [Nymphaea thermarum]
MFMHHREESLKRNIMYITYHVDTSIVQCFCKKYEFKDLAAQDDRAFEDMRHANESLDEVLSFCHKNNKQRANLTTPDPSEKRRNGSSINIIFDNCC